MKREITPVPLGEPDGLQRPYEAERVHGLTINPDGESEFTVRFESRPAPVEQRV